MKPAEYLLAGDLGGTKTVLALYRQTAEGLRPLRQETFKSQPFSSFDNILKRFWKGPAKKNISRICLGVPGPVRDGRVITTNLPWLLDERQLARSTGAGKVRLLNDLQAAAYGMLFLKEKDFVVLNPGAPPRQPGNMAVIAAGTGLGEAFLYRSGRGYHPVASEGGHTDFAPRNDQEAALLRFLCAQYGHVSYERLLSGPGLFNIYRFLKASGVATEPDWLKKTLQKDDPGAVITRLALKKRHKLCMQAVDLFVSIYGAEAGNLALKVLATGGVYIGGGIAPKILKKLQEGSFMESFVNKGRYKRLLSEVPVRVALNSAAPLIGAAHYALRL